MLRDAVHSARLLYRELIDALLFIITVLRLLMQSAYVGIGAGALALALELE